MSFVDTNDDVFLSETSFATWHEALDRYETLPGAQELSPDMARQAQELLPRRGST
jgi:hypothetical protein